MTMRMDDGVLVIAEAGVNHNGSRERALAMVDAAADAGADVVKFQTFRAERLVTRSARKAAYQEANTGSGGGQFEMLKALELSDDDHRAILARCAARGIAFLSTAFDAESLSFLLGLGMPLVKIPSGDVTAAPLLLDAARSGRPLVVSTGMCTLREVEDALAVIAFGLAHPSGHPSRDDLALAHQDPQVRQLLAERVVLLHCVTEYPAPPASVNLRAMETLRSAFGLRVGYSDHTLGTDVAIASVALGATVLEKHFTLDRTLPGPDHAASLEPAELTQLVASVRRVREALGSTQKGPVGAERENRGVARRSLVAARAIRAGSVFVEADFAMKRPGDGISPMRIWELLGTTATRDYAPDDLI